MPKSALMALMGLVVTTSCATVQEQSGVSRASAELVDPRGETVATAELSQHAGGLQITVHATALPPGTHGIHLHEVGRCTRPDFASAGGHFDPAGRQHGFENPRGPHAGDLPNIQVGSDGTGHFTLENERATLTRGPSSLFDADGSAIVIHARADDYRTDPSGDSGERIACGEIVPAGAR